ncbi:MAG TPA: hypothetical protein VG722_12460 [Tepidisphaeraceae bacterium]|nr:hypothetical protein [Tepidisphaeraceae bacterium]
MKQNIFQSGVLLLAMACAARGDATVYSDRASFEAAIGPSVTYTFETDEGFPAAPAYINSFGPVQVYNIEAGYGPAYLFNLPEGTTNQLLAGAPNQYNPNETNDLYAVFTAPEYAMGFDVYLSQPAVGVNVYFGDGSSSDFYALYGDLDTPDVPVFFGITSSDAISYFTVEPIASSRNQFYQGIDNFTIVPEPVVVNILMPLVALLVQRDRK